MRCRRPLYLSHDTSVNRHSFITLHCTAQHSTKPLLSIPPHPRCISILHVLIFLHLVSSYLISNSIFSSLSHLIFSLIFPFLFSMQDPKMPSAQIKAHYDSIVREIEEAFSGIVDV